MDSIDPGTGRSCGEGRRLRRRELAQELTLEGFPIAERTLAKLASVGGGPPFQRFGRWRIYEWGAALAWAQEKISAPVTRARDLGHA